MYVYIYIYIYIYTRVRSSGAPRESFISFRASWIALCFVAYGFSFALGWCLFSSGFSQRLPLGATRVRGAHLRLRVGAISACSKGSSIFGKCRTRMILYGFTIAPLSPAMFHPFNFFRTCCSHPGLCQARWLEAALPWQCAAD